MSSEQSPTTPETAPSVFQRWGRSGTGIVLALAAVVMLLIGGTIGLALGTSSPTTSASTKPAANSVDVGFLRDMSVHHEQGVLISHIVQGNGGSSEVAGIAYDIEYQQTSQIGQMGGFLQLWDYPLTSTNAVMSWMTADGGHNMAGMSMMAVDPAAAADGAVMPGMATNAEVNRLKTLRGAESDAYFLQLMIRHHEGGLPMMEYAQKYATNGVVQNMAGKMVQSQQAEIVSMTQLLKEMFGESPLPTAGAAAPSSSGTGTTSTVTPSAAVPTSGDPTGVDMSGMNMAPTTS